MSLGIHQLPPGLLGYIMVDMVASTLNSIVADGGEIVRPFGADAMEFTARFPRSRRNCLGTLPATS
ncbi:MAG: hypothetical protein ACREJD_04935 [Phycisphaerales bacterium]